MTEPCPHDESWFDRSICPEPCGTMHDYCVKCGECVDPCYWRSPKGELVLERGLADQLRAKGWTVLEP